MSLGLDEEKAKAVEAETQVDDVYGKLRIIWLGILATLVVLFVVTRVVEAGPGGGLEVMVWGLLALGVAELSASFVLKQKMLRQAAEQRKPGLISTAYILAFALCESVGIFGLIAHFVTGSKYYYFFFVLSGFGLVLHKPQRDDVLAAVAGPGGVGEAKKQG